VFKTFFNTKATMPKDKVQISTPRTEALVDMQLKTSRLSYIIK
jgi:hypothetical protein